MLGDREKWNARHAQGGSRPPSALVTALDAELPRVGRALDVAGGAGRHALWLARRGLDVTLVDVSDVALAQAAQQDPAPGHLSTLPRDLEEAPLPPGPWELIVVFDYLQRSLFAPIAEALTSGGLLLYVHPTRPNLERHASPSARFLLEPGELSAAFADMLEIVRHEEGWSEEGRHQARLLARRR